MSHYPKDARRTLLSLTEAGKAQLEKHCEVDRVVAEAYETLMQEADARIFDALWRIEAACREEPLLERLRRAERAVAQERRRPARARRSENEEA